MKKILITGGSGFIGSHTCLLLLEKGYEIHSIDSNINSYEKSLDIVRNFYNKNIERQNKLFSYKGDIRNKEFLEKIFINLQKKGESFCGVIHFAGLKSVNESKKNPIKYWDVNVNGTINLLKIMDKYNCRNLVFSSTAMIYYNKSDSALKETDKIKPINPYGMTKLAIENLLDELYKSSEKNWRIANLRYFNPIGAHTSGIIGENPKGIAQNIFPRINDAAIGKIKALKVFGKTYPTFDGTPIRDYVHVMDIADGHLKALDALRNEDPRILTINLGTNIGTSVLELIKTFKEANNIEVPYEFAEKRLGEPAILISDISLAKKLLNWEPKRNLTEMCIDGWNWIKKNPKGYKT